MSAGGVQLVGFDELDRKLQRLSEGKRDKLVMDALFQGGEVIAAEARRLVPVRTGNLRDSIVVTASAGNFSHISASKDLATVYVGPQQGTNKAHDGFYGHMVEFGTEHSAAHPFMRPALDTKLEEAQHVVMSVLLQSVLEAAR